jgi:GDP-D-mannose dehydratase
MAKKALITGISGQDGSYLAELLLLASSGEMFGMVREVPQTERTPFYPRPRSFKTGFPQTT